MIATQTFEPDGRAVPFADEGGGPALVLIPGLSMNIASLATLAGSLAEADFRVVRIGTRRPVGQPDAAVSLHDLARDVADVLSHLGIDDAWIGGHAFGGAVARAVSRDHPDRVNGVLLLGVETPADAAADQTPDKDGHLAQVVAELRDTAAEPTQRTALAVTPNDEWEAPAPGVPVLVVQGAVDRITPEANGRALQAAAPHLVSVVTVDGGGHWFPLTHAGQTSLAIEDYLDWD